MLCLSNFICMYKNLVQIGTLDYPLYMDGRCGIILYTIDIAHKKQSIANCNNIM